MPKENNAVNTEEANNAVNAEEVNNAVSTEEANNAVNTDEVNNAVNTEEANDAVNAEEVNNVVNTDEVNNNSVPVNDPEINLNAEDKIEENFNIDNYIELEKNSENDLNAFLAEEEDSKPEEKEEIEYNQMLFYSKLTGNIADDISDILVKHFQTSKKMSAIDEEGHVYNGYNAIVKKLSDPDWTKKLYIYDEDMEYPYAFEKNENAEMYISEFPVSLKNPLSRFEIKPSLDFEDIYTHYDLKRYRQVTDQIKLAQKIVRDQEEIKNQTYIHLQDQLIALNQRFKGSAPESSFNAPATPDGSYSMSFGTNVKCFFVRIFTLGRRKAKEEILFDAYKQEAKIYREQNQNKQKLIDDKISKVQDKSKTLHATFKTLDEKVGGLYFNINHIGDFSKKVNDYHEHMEVRLEGLNDFRKNGLTYKNIFSQTWILKSNLEGKTIKDVKSVNQVFDEFSKSSLENKTYEEIKSDVDREKRLMYELENQVIGPTHKEDVAKYLLYEAAQERILRDTNSYWKTTASLSAAVIREICSEQNLKKLLKNPDFMPILEKYTHEPIECDTLLKEYKDMQKYFTPSEKLQEHRKNLIEKFGNKEISMDCLSAIAKLCLLDDEMKKEYDYKGAIKIVSDLSLKPESKSSTRIIPKASMKLYYGKEYKKALEHLVKNAKKTEDTMRNLLKQMEQKGVSQDSLAYKTLAQNIQKGKTTYSLEEMKDLVQETVEKNHIKKMGKANTKDKNEKIL